MALLGLLMLAVHAPSAGAAISLPSGFETRTLADGFDLPTSAAWAPDGRIFVIEKAGKVKVVNPGGGTQLLLDITDHVNTYTDRGLLGLAVDADFASNHFIYILYYHDENPASVNGPKVGRLSRLEVNPDNTLVNPESPETVILGSVDTGPCFPASNTVDCIPGEGASHGIGTVRADPDGTLWVGVGDADYEQFRTFNTSSLAGKILHIDRDGKGLSDHPYCPAEADLTKNCTKVYALGFRNPFRFTLRDGTGPAVGDVGQEEQDEWDLVEPGRNYGWICYEGTVKTAGLADHGGCQDLYSKEGTSAGVAFPEYAYTHGEEGASVLGGPQYRGDDYPAQYHGDFFIGDYSRGWIKTIDLDATTGRFNSIAPFATDGFIGVDLLSDPVTDNLVYVDIGFGGPGEGSIKEVVYTPGNRTPTAVVAATPTNGDPPLTVSFTGDGSSDPDGDALTYDWDFGDGTAHSTEANPTHVYESDGLYTAKLTVDDGRGRQHSATAKIAVGNTPPQATITAPLDNSLASSGETVQLRGTGSDANDAELPESAFTWHVLMKHGTHYHDLGQFIGREASFTTNTDHGEEASYEVRLMVTDSGGLTGTDVHFVKPRTIPLTLESSPAGARLTYASTEKPAPWAVEAGAGFRTDIAARTRFVAADGRPYRFVSWSDGGEQSHEITVPETATTLTATYRLQGHAVKEGEALTFYAGAGEVNDVAVTEDETNIRFTDPTNAIYPLAGCVAVTDNAVDCAKSGVNSVNVRLNGGDDAAVSQIARRVVFFGGDGADTITGGTGNDYISGGSDGDTVDGGPGTDHVEGNEGIDIVRGGDDADYLSAGPGDDVVEGGAGSDVMLGGTGADRYAGGAGIDRASYSGQTGPIAVTIDGVEGDGAEGEGDDVELDVENVDATSAADTLTGSDLPNYLDGGGGNDQIDGREGSDHIAGQSGDDRLTGGAGLDYLDAGAGADRAEGGADDDVIDGGTGTDAISGGAGNDRVTYIGRTNQVRVYIDGITNDGEAGELDMVDGTIEQATGGSGNDILVGNEVNNFIDGGPGNDHLDGMGGNDHLDGYGGDDFLTGGAGDDFIRGMEGADILEGGLNSDTLLGGAGTIDKVIYSASFVAVTADLDGVRDDGAAGEFDLIGSDVERLRGGAGDDKLTGDGGANSLEGLGGSDTLFGEGGNDFLNGAGGNDTMNGGAGSDTLRAYEGDDTLNGNADDDWLDPGTGSDTMNGHGGFDRAVYLDRVNAVEVTLDGVKNDGELGELDDVADDVENVSGGSGADVLIGNGLANILDGGMGDDRLTGGAALDFLVGAAGEDTIDSRDAGVDAVTCGAGAADVSLADSADNVDGDCETITRGAPLGGGAL